MGRNTDQLSLDPQNHRDGVNMFMEYFRLNQKRAGVIFLQDIIERFSSLPYENISKIIKLNNFWESEAKIRLPEEIIHDHIASHLGGTCFSLTFFLQAVLALNGFICYPVMADMHAGRNIHCCLMAVLSDMHYLIDPGYLLHQPMEITAEKPRLYRTAFAGVELQFDHQSGYFHLYTFDENERTWRYRFQDRPTPPEEFLHHWHASFWKPTLHGILLTKVTKGGLIYVHKTFMRETTFEGKRNINIKKNYHDAIQAAFNIDPQLVEQAQAALKENLVRERASGALPFNIKNPAVG